MNTTYFEHIHLQLPLFNYSIVPLIQFYSHIHVFFLVVITINTLSPVDAVLMYQNIGPSTRTWTTYQMTYPQMNVTIPPSEAISW